MEDEFELFWSVYARHIGKGAARLAFARARKKAALNVIMEGLSRSLKEWDARGEPQYIPHASTWLNQERWTDEYDAPAPASGTSESPELKQWRLRVKFYKKDSFWLPFWGEKPDDPRCAAPVEVLNEFGFRAMH